MISTVLALLSVILAVHAAWVLVRNPKDWPILRRNAYAGCVLVAATGATLWTWGWESSIESITGTLGVILTVLGCLGASFISRRKSEDSEDLDDLDD
ncbi:hypothetical protein [Kineosporia babensis]|uniref:Uncharacterized protein n=1 Tax=Kineosporia babensis TaxID=499548 RepID=A0A9X1NJ58_9ACTN|nr:hypothetical protein [Kineosporia babensis]MCD5315992.1 hypothetical protein [Kineosporia babensis]